MYKITLTSPNGTEVVRYVTGKIETPTSDLLILKFDDAIAVRSGETLKIEFIHAGSTVNAPGANN